MSGNAHEPKGARLRRLVFICLALLALGAVGIVLFETRDEVDVSRSTAPPPAQVVSVLLVESAKANATISTFAELRPRWRAEIRAAVSGRILTVHDAALAGTRVAQGTPLFTIESSQYETMVATAKLALEEARLVRLRAENKVIVARKQFQRDGVAPPNDLAVHLPELRIAEHSVTSAEAQLAAADRRLADTVVTAPFSGFVTERMVSLGQTISQGDALLSLSDDTRFELVAKLGQADWALLDHPIAGQAARLFHLDGRPLGIARIRRGGGFLDADTRQMHIFLEVSDPAEDVLAGDFLRIAFDGRTIENTVSVPETAVTRTGHIWLVDAEDRLVRITPEILFRNERVLTIAVPDQPGPWRVVRTPMAGFLPGQRVAPVNVEP